MAQEEEEEEGVEQLHLQQYWMQLMLVHLVQQTRRQVSMSWQQAKLNLARYVQAAGSDTSLSLAVHICMCHLSNGRVHLHGCWAAV